LERANLFLEAANLFLERAKGFLERANPFLDSANGFLDRAKGFLDCAEGFLDENCPFLEISRSASIPARVSARRSIYDLWRSPHEVRAFYHKEYLKPLLRAGFCIII
jgi:hypothetical protein